MGLIVRIDEPGKKKRRGKFNARKYRFFGIEFDSKHEAHRYLDLRDRWQRGEITEPKVHVPFPICIGGTPVVYETGRQMVYEADFVYRIRATGEQVIEDAKSPPTRKASGYRIKRALMHTMGLTIVEV